MLFAMSGLRDDVIARLRRLIDYYGTQAQLAEAMGIDQGTISNVLNKKRQAGVTFLELMRSAEARVGAEPQVRYANLEVAISQIGTSLLPETIENVRRHGLRSASDLPVKKWLAYLLAEDDLIRSDKADPESAEQRERDSEATTAKAIKIADAYGAAEREAMRKATRR